MEPAAAAADPAAAAAAARREEKRRARNAASCAAYRARKRPRSKVTTACNECVRRKFKCDGARPCVLCAHYDVVCVYRVTAKRGRKPRPPPPPPPPPPPRPRRYLFVNIDGFEWGDIGSDDELDTLWDGP